MAQKRSGFICICPQKAVCLGADRHLHRDDHDEQLHAELNATAAAEAGDGSADTYAFLSGGGVRAINPGPELTLAQSENCFVVCKGRLHNRADVISHAGGCEAASDAELLRLMYAKYGVDMLGRLDGHFAFCLYDSKQARVLAARDPSGSHGLVEGRTPAGSLLICCGTFLPDGAHDVTKIHPGQFKYGWHALPRPYVAGPTQQVGRPSLDHGIRRRSIDAHRDVAGSAPARRSYEIPSPATGGAAAAAAAASQVRHSFDNPQLMRRSFDAARPARAGAGATGQPAAAPHGAHGIGHGHGHGHGGAGGARNSVAPAPAARQRRASSPGGRPAAGPRSPAAPAAAPGPAAAAAAAAHKARRPRHRKPCNSHGGGAAGDAGSDDGSVGSNGSRGTHDSGASGGRKPAAPAAPAAAAPARPAAPAARAARPAAAAACERSAPVSAEGATMLANALQGLAC